MDFLFAFNPNKLKPNLKMSVQRIIIKKQKAAAIALKQKKEIASLLTDGKEEKARIRTEGVIRSDFQIEAYEIIELLCELLAERMNLVTSEKRCPADLRECVSTLIWCANRTDIPELKEVRHQLVKKYGSDFEKAAMQNLNGCVNERIIVKLNVKPPNAFLVHSYMKEIAIANNIDWSPLEDDMSSMEPMPAPCGFSIEPGSVSQIPQPNGQLPLHQFPPMTVPGPQVYALDPALHKGADGYGLPQAPTQAPQDAPFPGAVTQAQYAPFPGAPTQAQHAPFPGVSQTEIGGLPDVPLSGPTVTAYAVPPGQQQHPGQQQYPPAASQFSQAPSEFPQMPPPAPGSSNTDQTSAGFDDLQARLDALKRK